MGFGETCLFHNSGWERRFAAVRVESAGSITSEHFMTISSSIHVDAPNATDYDVRTLAITLLRRHNIYRLYVHCTTSNFRIWMSASTSYEAPVGSSKT
jgi:hypothetical protein